MTFSLLSYGALGKFGGHSLKMELLLVDMTVSQVDQSTSTHCMSCMSGCVHATYITLWISANQI